MSVSSPDQPSIEDLAEEFLERRRRGERPSLDEYAARYPDLAGEIREFFPVLGLVEANQDQRVVQPMAPQHLQGYATAQHPAE